jgi:hypothetical protein
MNALCSVCRVEVVPDIVLLEDDLKVLVVAADLVSDHVGLVGDQSEVELVQLLQQGHQPLEPKNNRIQGCTKVKTILCLLVFYNTLLKVPKRENLELPFLH